MASSHSAHDTLKACVRKSLHQYLDDLQGQEPGNMHDMLRRAVEQPLLQLVMEQTRYNQSKASQWLGLNRNTLRKKLAEYGLLCAEDKQK